MLKGKKILVTAGPTHEPIDPVRFIGNHSSGKMGYSIVDELVQKGVIVTLVSGPTSIRANENAEVFNVQSAQQMFEAVQSKMKEQDAFIFSAAVADYTPKEVSDIKLKKNDSEMFISLKKTVDIAKEVGRTKEDKQISVGFALETNNEEEHAKKKLVSKNLDFVVLNSMRNEGTCFGSDNNKITIFSKDEKLEFDSKPKVEVAKDIVSYLSERFK